VGDTPRSLKINYGELNQGEKENPYSIHEEK
jgi:hypothetical protein